jgi:AraC-like DNA-binding protein
MLNSNFATEIHYTVAEIAKIWHMSPNKVRSLFADELGVVRFGREESRFKRANVHLRIPASVMERVHNRLRLQ